MIRILNFLYSTTIGSSLRRLLTRHAWFSRSVGFYCNRSLSKIHIRSFIKKHSIQSNEFKKNINEFTSFNDFFIRELNNDARPIDSDQYSVVSPADGIVSIIPAINKTSLFEIKNMIFSLEHLLKDNKLISLYQNGLMISIRLQPWDYHRFHFPLACQPTKARPIKGHYESVNPLVFNYGINPYLENERQITLLKNTLCDDIIMVSVGALCVGTIKLLYTPDSVYRKGDQAGYFCFGGSTILLIFKKNAFQLDNQLILGYMHNREILIKMGQRLGIAHR